VVRHRPRPTLGCRGVRAPRSRTRPGAPRPRDPATEGLAIPTRTSDHSLRRHLGILLATAAILVATAVPSLAQTAYTLPDDPNSDHEPADRVVALTFDDGPQMPYTLQILDVLEAYSVPATFFVVGAQVVEHPDLVAAAHARRHTVANHSWDHARLTELDDAAVREQITETRGIIADHTGQGPDDAPSCLRPPFGDYDERIVAIAADEGYRTALWTVDPRDWERPGTDAIVDRVLADVEPGAVILLHDGFEDREQTVAALPRIIEGIHAQGYEIVPWCRPAAPFVDIYGSVHGANIEQAADRGWTQGTTADRYEPGRDVTRGQVASLVARAYDVPDGDPDRFPDVTGSVHRYAIGGLAEASVLEGYGDGTFGPQDPMSRAEIASVLARVDDRLEPVTPTRFADARGSVHEGAIEALAEAGITQGCDEDRYCPDASVRRSQMASLLVRALA
jgi:peptidoglycan-N-acetylglucosamine deacetylase